MKQQSHDDYAEQDQEAREYVTRLLGKEPAGDPVAKGVIAFAFSAIVPWLGLPLLGVPMSIIETPLLVVGGLCGLGVWWYHKSKRDEWSRAWAQRIVDADRYR